MKKLPIGMQVFRQIISGGYVYVDKTRSIYELITQGKNYFLSRPRRFGKTLTCSTLESLFKGEKELFKDTWIYDHWDFKPYPVISISMAELNTETPGTVRETLIGKLKDMYKAYGLIPDTDDYKMLFIRLINALSVHGDVVVIIDEYDYPMLAHLGDPAAADAIRKVMREFYYVLKVTEASLRFVLLTGITKISKAGLFSTLNHLNEISFNSKYAEMLGYTETEMETYFDDFLREGSARLQISREELIARIKDYYDGFSFDGGHFVYNPFSMLCFFAEYRFESFWIQSGLSQSLIEYAKKRELTPERYLHTYLNETTLTSYEIESAPPESFLAQAGYLTFKARHEYLGYLLDYPNREVRDSFSSIILLSSYNLDALTKNNIVTDIVLGFENHDFDRVFDAMTRTFAAIPAKLYDNRKGYVEKEAYYHSIMLTLLWACELHVHAEEWTNRGMSDLVIEYRGDIWVIELKRMPAEAALKQITDKGYAKKYTSAPYLALVGIEIDVEQRNLKKYVIAQ
jgi:hypothetical protein